MNANATKIWKYFSECGMSEYGISGLMGNLDCESGLRPDNLEDYYAAKYGFTDDSYVRAVDNGTHNFVDNCGFGLAQWTWHTRKRELLEFARNRQVSIADLDMQLDFLKYELQNKFAPVWNTLMNAKSVYEASNSVLLGFEAPLDQSTAVQNQRAALGKTYYDAFANRGGTDMEYIICKKRSNQKLSKNFTSNEFDCHGSGCCSQTKIHPKLVEYLQMIRDYFGTSVTITSGHRCKIHNKSICGATASRHIAGDAADIVVANHSPIEVARYAESIGIKGIGLYNTAKDGYFVHIDVRETKSFWYGQAQEYRSTFGGKVQSVPDSNLNSNLIVYGATGDGVTDLQEKLIKLGYSCGSCGADGSFGLGTQNALKAFQKDAGFSKAEQDGIYGKKTKAALEAAISRLGIEYIVTADVLNVRSGAGAENKIVTTVKRGDLLLITNEKDGWGETKNGWVSLRYCQRKG